MKRRFTSTVVVAAVILVQLPAAEMNPGDTAKETNLPALPALAARVETELRANILPFWLQHARDRERGGFHGEISNDLVVNQDAPRGALLTSRVLWAFSAAYRRYRDPAYLDMARWAYVDLTQRFWDDEFSGLYWSITADGKPLDTRKQIYGQVFGIYALAEFHRATGEAEALASARAIYRTIEQRARDHEHGGYFEAFDREWRRIDRAGRGVMGPNAGKSQNTHLHIMEAYTNLLRVWPDAELRRDLAQLVEVMLTKVLDPASHHLHLFLEDDWTPVSDGISYGHDIEFSWLLVETADVLGDTELIARVKPIAVAVARATDAEGVDPDGGVLNEADPRGVTDPAKDWWPQAEAVVGFTNAYQLSGDASFLRAAERSWKFIDAHLIDHERGEWFWGVSRDGKDLAARPKVSLWKCPYHNSRACLEFIERLHAIGERGVP